MVRSGALPNSNLKKKKKMGDTTLGHIRAVTDGAWAVADGGGELLTAVAGQGAVVLGGKVLRRAMGKNRKDRVMKECPGAVVLQQCG